MQTMIVKKPKLNLNEVKHIEDLPVPIFIDYLRNFSKFTISEKVDGSNIQFGIDEIGFYTSREEFGGEKKYSVDEYDISYSTTYMRSAHLVLEKVLGDLIAAGLSKGDRIEAEVLFGELPNVIPYDSKVNRIVFLRTVTGNVSIRQLKEQVIGKRINVEVQTPSTADGKTIQVDNIEYEWEFDQTPTYDGSDFSKSKVMKKINKELDQMEEYLKSDSGIVGFTNTDIISIPLNKIPSSVHRHNWKEIKELIKDKRKEVEDVVGNRYKIKIKNMLLDNMVRNVGSQFGPDVDNGGWIEGVVVRNSDTGEQFKIVDKSIFRTIKDFLYDVRSELTDHPVSLKNVTSFVGKLKVGLSNIIGHPELGTAQAKRYLKKHGRSKEEILNNLDNFDYLDVKYKWMNFLESKEKELEVRLEKYNKEKHDKKIVVDVGCRKQEFSYDGEIDKRTMQTFSNLFALINKYRNSIRNSKSSKDLVLVLIGDKIHKV